MVIIHELLQLYGGAIKAAELVGTFTGRGGNLKKTRRDANKKEKVEPLTPRPQETYQKISLNLISNAKLVEIYLCIFRRVSRIFDQNFETFYELGEFPCIKIAKYKNVYFKVRDGPSILAILQLLHNFSLVSWPFPFLKIFLLHNVQCPNFTIITFL